MCQAAGRYAGQAGLCSGLHCDKLRRPQRVERDPDLPHSTSTGGPISDDDVSCSGAHATPDRRLDRTGAHGRVSVIRISSWSTIVASSLGYSSGLRDGLRTVYQSSMTCFTSLV